jgi:hypothetical protein
MVHASISVPLSINPPLLGKEESGREVSHLNVPTDV